jgi:thermitase
LFKRGLIFSIGLLSCGLMQAFADTCPEFIEKEFIISYPRAQSREADRARAAFFATLGAQTTREIFSDNIDRTFWEVRLHSDRDPAEIRAQAGTLLQSVERNCIRRARLTAPNDPALVSQWGLYNPATIGPRVDIAAPEAWSVLSGSKNVVMAVLDTGVDYFHPDLTANIWRNSGEIPGNKKDDDGNGVIDDYYGYNAALKNGDPYESDKHGTHVAGILGASGNNGIGGTGVLQQAQIMAVRVFKKLGSNDFGATDVDILDGLSYLYKMRASYGVPIRVINASLGSTGPCPQSYLAALNKLNDVGVTFVAAAGNDSLNNDLIPDSPSGCGSPNVIAVAAGTPGGTRADFSNFGPKKVHILAPGIGILSTLPQGLYGFFSGTSMAAPYVSGAVAGVSALNPTLSPAQIRDIIVSTATALPTVKGMLVAGGMLNMHHAFLVAQNPDSDPESSDGEIDVTFAMPELAVMNVAPKKLKSKGGKVNINLSVKNYESVQAIYFYQYSKAGKLIATIPVFPQYIEAGSVAYYKGELKVKKSQTKTPKIFFSKLVIQTFQGTQTSYFGPLLKVAAALTK